MSEATPEPADAPVDDTPEPPTLYGVPLSDSRGQRVLHPSREQYVALARTLLDETYTTCSDLTAVDYLTFMGRSLPAGVTAERFEVVVNLLSIERRPRDHKVVENAAFFAQKNGIAHAAFLELADLAGDEAFDRTRDISVRFVASQGRARRGEERLPHMGDVEKPRFLARMKVFLQHAVRVLNRHFIACEFNHLRAEREMEPMQGRAL